MNGIFPTFGRKLRPTQYVLDVAQHARLLLMYYVLKSEETPRGDKLIVYSTLAYLTLPINLISMRRHPIIGWFDEAASIVVAFQKIRQNVTPEMEQQVEQTLDKWFAEYVAYEAVG